MYHAVTLKIDRLLQWRWKRRRPLLHERRFSGCRREFLESYRNARAKEDGGEEGLRLEELITRDHFEPQCIPDRDKRPR